MFWDVEDEELEKLFDYWIDHLYFDRVLLSVGFYFYLIFATPRGLELLFTPFLMPFYLWGILPFPAY